MLPPSTAPLVARAHHTLCCRNAATPTAPRPSLLTAPAALPPSPTSAPLRPLQALQWQRRSSARHPAPPPLAIAISPRLLLLMAQQRRGPPSVRAPRSLLPIPSSKILLRPAPPPTLSTGVQRESIASTLVVRTAAHWQLAPILMVPLPSPETVRAVQMLPLPRTESIAVLKLPSATSLTPRSAPMKMVPLPSMAPVLVATRLPTLMPRTESFAEW